METAKQLVARIGGEQRLSYTVTPQADSLIPANSLGGQLVALSDLFKSLGKEDGVNLTTLVSAISMDDAGVIRFDLVIAKVEPA